MLAYNNSRITPRFASFEHLASSITPRRVLCVFSRRKGMNLVVNLGRIESRNTRGALEFCGCGMSNLRGGVIVRSSVLGGDWDLEGEILEFMKKSKKPAAFPSKKELIEAGRMDLVLGIEREGGWLALGWDMEDEVVGSGGDDAKDWEATVATSSDRIVSERKSETFLENGSIVQDESLGVGTESSSALSSSVGRQGVYSEEAMGIEGILNRLGKERTSAFGVTLKEQEMLDHALSDNNKGGMPVGSLSNVTVAGHDRGSDKSTNNYQAIRSQDMWQTWSRPKAGISDVEFEAAGVPFNMKSDAEVDKVLNDKICTTDKTIDRTDFSGVQYNPEFIQNRLHNLELELSATLKSLKSESDESTILKANKDLSEEMQNVSDALEFKQTDIMRAKDKLRSIRAKLAVLEGKTAMAMIDARKMVELKQKKIDQARHALQLLRDISIIWPNSASVVLLTGSFDGWTTQRKMDRSPTGIHSLSLKLYPGIYEIKFIVDGIWRIDPLRPITLSNGFENNLLTVN